MIQRVSGSASYERIVKFLAEYDVDAIVVGWPLLIDGSEGKQVRSVAAYLRGLAAYSVLPIVRWDERFSTTEANMIMRANEVGRRAQKRRRDAVAAAVILQEYLDQQTERMSE